MLVLVYRQQRISCMKKITKHIVYDIAVYKRSMVVGKVFSKKLVKIDEDKILHVSISWLVSSSSSLL